MTHMFKIVLEISPMIHCHFKSDSKSIYQWKNSIEKARSFVENSSYQLYCKYVAGKNSKTEKSNEVLNHHLKRFFSILLLPWKFPTYCTTPHPSRDISVQWDHISNKGSLCMELIRVRPLYIFPSVANTVQQSC